MPRRVRSATAVAEAARIAAELSGRTVFVGVDGRAGSGKSTLAAAIAAAVPGAVVVHADDFAGPHVPEWDWPRFAAEVVEPLRAGRQARYQRWEWNRDEPAEWHEVADPAALIVEGCGTLSRRATPFARLAIWADADDVLRKRRALDRDGATFAAHWEQWQGEFERYVAREDPRRNATLRIDVTDWPLGGRRLRRDGTTVGS